MLGSRDGNTPVPRSRVYHIPPESSTRETFRALRPFSVCSVSNSTVSPSRRSSLLPPPTLLWWTNTSSPPLSGAMKPYPFSLLNHFTVPRSIIVVSFCEASPVPNHEENRRDTPCSLESGLAIVMHVELGCIFTGKRAIRFRTPGVPAPSSRIPRLREGHPSIVVGSLGEEECT